MDEGVKGTRETRETRGTVCCGEGGALVDACIKTDATRSTVAVGYPLANQTNDTRAKHIFSSEGVRYNARRISWRWAVLWSTAHCQDNSLAAVDNPLSRKKNDPQKSIVLVGLPGFELHYQWCIHH